MGGLAGGCISTAIIQPKTETVKVEVVQPGTLPVEHNNLPDLVDEVMPSMVSVMTKSVETYEFFFDMYDQEIEGAGSGIIVGKNDNEMLIVTNEHVINGVNSVSIRFIDGEVVEGIVKSYDTTADIAIVAIPINDIKKETLEAIKIAAIGSSDDMRVGDSVIAIGNAYGYGESVTKGIISALDREVADNKGNTMTLIQTDAAINPGNSGGALLNMNGEVIGINESKIADTNVEGMGFAIPISKQMDKINELLNVITRQKVVDSKRGYLNITCATVDKVGTEYYGIPEGAIVSELEEGGAADKAGIKKRDVITHFDGQSITGSDELVEKLEYYAADEEINVKLQRYNGEEYEEVEVVVTLAKKK